MKNLLIFISGLLFVNLLYAELLYQKTDKPVSDLLRADSFSSASLNYQNTALIKKFRQYTPSVAFISKPQLKLAGLRINPKNYTGISSSYTNRLVYFDMQKRNDREIAFPKGTIISQSGWPEDGRHFLVSIETPSCLELWMVDIPSLKKKRIPGLCLNQITGNSFLWLNDQEILISKRLKSQQSEIKIEKLPPTGPVVQVSKGMVAQNRTYQDLLKNQQDEEVLAKAIQAQLVIHNIKSGSTRDFGKPAAYYDISLSPDRTRFLISKITKPYSYAVPLGYFTKSYEVWDVRGGGTVPLYKSGPHENVPINGVIKGPRGLHWLPDEPATLIYVEALDGGDWKNKVAFRDEIFKLHLLANSQTRVESIYKTKNRFAGLKVLDRGLGYMVSDYERDSTFINTKLIKYENLKIVSEKEIFNFNESDEYGNPGSEYMIDNKYKRAVVAVEKDNQSIFLVGRGATPEGYRPFLNRFNFSTLEKREIFRSSDKTFESFLTFVDETDFTSFLTSYETNRISPRIMLNTIGATETKKELLYADTNPFEIMSKLKKEVIKYKRNDGVELSGVLYYPLDYEVGKKYPMVMEAYPLEYTDAATAGQVRSTPYKFETPFRADAVYFALRGYAYLQDAQIPIIGHPETKNDTFLPQLVAGAEAAIAAVAAKNLIDVKKVGIIGHSYGGFMVANLLTHSKLFAAGIARSGAYNRTLTPFGFQGERRTFWDAKDTYLKVSPFYEAEKMKFPMLLIHGQADNNSGTFTLQSERYFEALKGQGANVRLVLLPEESHGYAALESVEHVLYEMFNWFDTYLK